MKKVAILLVAIVLALLLFQGVAVTDTLAAPPADGPGWQYYHGYPPHWQPNYPHQYPYYNRYYTNYRYYHYPNYHYYYPNYCCKTYRYTYSGYYCCGPRYTYNYRYW